MIMRLFISLYMRVCVSLFFFLRLFVSASLYICASFYNRVPTSGETAGYDALVKNDDNCFASSSASSSFVFAPVTLYPRIIVSLMLFSLFLVPDFDGKDNNLILILR